MTEFVGSTKAQLGVATHQNIRKGRGDGVPKPETAVFFFNFRNDEEISKLILVLLFLPQLCVSVYISGVWTL
jgi:hypothetical protein